MAQAGVTRPEIASSIGIGEDALRKHFRDELARFPAAKSGRKIIDLMGNRYGRLLVVGQGHSKTGQLIWNCVCDCGGQTWSQGHGLTNGARKSCGCLQREGLTVSAKFIAAGERGRAISADARRLEPEERNRRRSIRYKLAKQRFRERIRENERERDARDREDLSDRYIKRLIYGATGISAALITADAIKAKRESILLRRAVLGNRETYAPTEDQRSIVEKSSAEGRTQKQIASLLGLCDATIRKHFKDEIKRGKDVFINTIRKIVCDRQCVKCEMVLPVELFIKNPTKKDGRSSWCKPCRLAYRKAKAKESNKKFKKLNKKRDRENLNPQYIKSKLSQRSSIKYGQIPGELIELKREQLRLYRTVRQAKQLLKEKS